MDVRQPPLALSSRVTIYLSATCLLALLLVFATAKTAWAQGAPSRDKGRSLEGMTQSIIALGERHRVSGLSAEALPAGDLLQTAAERKKLLAELIEDHPDQVLKVALPRNLRERLPRAVQAYVEEEVEAEGELQVLYECGRSGSRLRHFLDTGRERLSLHFAADRPEHLESGSYVRVAGVQVDSALALDSGSTNVAPLVQAFATTTGEQKVLVILVNFQNNPIQPYTRDSARSVTFTKTSDYYRDVSRQRAWFTGDVVGWYTIPMSSTTTDYYGVANAAQSAARAAGVNVSAYSRLVFAFPSASFGWWGLGSVGGSPSYAWINGSYQHTVLGHELGHNFGLYHSHAYECGSSVIGSGCSSIEYGDPLDIMGGASWAGHFNSFQKSRLGWMDGNTLAVAQAAGTYQLLPYEGSTGASPLALKVPKGSSSTYYYVEFRQAIGFDSFLSSNQNVLNGVVVHMCSDSDANSSQLLDMTPETSTWNDPALCVGKSYSDSTAGLTIKVLSTSAGGASVQVIRGGSGGGPVCAPANPQVALSPAQSLWVEAGTPVTYTVSVTNKDSAECAAAGFNLAAKVPAGWSAVLGSSKLSLNPGAAASTTLKVTSPAAAANGFFDVVVDVSNGANASLKASATATYVISTSTKTTSFADDFNRADSSSLGSAWAKVLGSFSVVSKEARNAVTKGDHIVVIQNVRGRIQKVSADFASVDNNMGPAFCLLLRYQDAKNHYKIYRSTGGSSTLRISRVVGGVEKVLKYATLPNPQKNVLFRLEGRAEGTKLVLAFNGVDKVVINDESFTEGSVGLMIGRGFASHRADNFSATVE